MLVFSSICPHPPIIIPEIGDEASFQQVQLTIDAFKELHHRLVETKPDTLVVVSPHAPVEAAFLLNADSVLKGDFHNFGKDTGLEFRSDQELLKEIKKERLSEKIEFYHGPLDHGALVPLYYLVGAVKTKNAKIKNDFKPKLLLASVAFSSMAEHLAFGRLLAKVFKKSRQRIALIISGDLSHRLSPGAPAGFSPKAKEFDQKLTQFLEKGDSRAILEFDEDLIVEAGECGLLPIWVLLGVLEGRKWRMDRLSYEAPFGVGYLTGQIITNN